MAKLIIDIKKLTHNVQFITGKIKEFNNGSVFGVTKVLCAHSSIIQCFIENGCNGLADSRWQNLKKIRENPIYQIESKKRNIPLLNLRIPALSEIPNIVKYSDMTLVSEIETVKMLDKEALKQGKKYGLIPMVDLGDLREGIIPENAFKISFELWYKELHLFFTQIIQYKNIEFIGIGANLACFGGVEPSKENMELLVKLKKSIENDFNLKLKYISGSNSSGIPFLLSGKMPKEINHFRLGETMLLGVNVLNRKKIDNMFQDVFTIESEIIEYKVKPSFPIGKRGQNAFDDKVDFKKNGSIKRCICAIGRQDIFTDGLISFDKDIEILGASSDHLELDCTLSTVNYKVGDMICFSLTYGALLAASTSEYIDKIVINNF